MMRFSRTDPEFCRRVLAVGRYMTLYKARMWVEGIPVQTLILRQELANALADIHAPVDSKFRNEHYFLICVANALKWCEALTVHEPALSTSVDAFKASLPTAKELRNMREHDLEHQSGGGHHQRTYSHVNADIVADGSSTVHVNGQYLIGNRLDVGKTAAAAFEMAHRMPARDDRNWSDALRASGPIVV
jgi:hypothetical protein